MWRIPIKRNALESPHRMNVIILRILASYDARSHVGTSLVQYMLVITNLAHCIYGLVY